MFVIVFFNQVSFGFLFFFRCLTLDYKLYEIGEKTPWPEVRNRFYYCSREGKTFGSGYNNIYR